MPSGSGRWRSARTSGRWPGSGARHRRRRPSSGPPKTLGLPEEPADPAGLGRVGEELLGVLLLVVLEALPVIRQLAGEEDLARPRARGLVGRRRLGLLVARPQIGGPLGQETRAPPVQGAARRGP